MQDQPALTFNMTTAVPLPDQFQEEVAEWISAVAPQLNIQVSCNEELLSGCDVVGRQTIGKVIPPIHGVYIRDFVR